MPPDHGSRGCYLTTATPLEVVDNLITVAAGLALLRMESISVTPQHFQRILHRRGVKLYRVGRTLVFHPRIVAELVEERQQRG